MPTSLRARARARTRTRTHHPSYTRSGRSWHQLGQQFAFYTNWNYTVGPRDRGTPGPWAAWDWDLVGKLIAEPPLPFHPPTHPPTRSRC